LTKTKKHKGDYPSYTKPRKGQFRAAAWRRMNPSSNCQPKGLIEAEIPEKPL
jgi:hypothetical protein